ncbi:hypothetical protein ABER61_15485 [Brevibacillus formosus]|uniref:Restriction endonuclease type IV Mrr domain-containing protein n=2 Tax=Brevibacillus formosus TaxID=54913 RepID=A0A837KNZ4_9BACL|nr:hypothetical protein [Brevibacillus formosus]KLH98873.1 hypothetical protein AA984_10080 [Brevibacillus formosus]PSJ93576.1 hypothetical protein C7R91_20125 [Brevibacillus formosus]GED59503.1 hypothetical protein BFO01nite_36350 [Brevibacillus formosus]
MRETLIKNVKTLGIFSVILIHNTCRTLLGDEEDENSLLDTVMKAGDGIRIISVSIGIKVELRDFLVGEYQFDYKKPITTLISCCIFNDPISSKIKDIHGSFMANVYTITQHAVLANIVLQFLLKISDSREVSEKRKDKIKLERENAEEFINHFILLFIDLKEQFKVNYPDMYNNLVNLEEYVEQDKVSKLDYKNIYGILNGFMEGVYVDLSEIYERKKRAQALLVELKRCKPGKQEWMDYERIGIQILEFLFLPRFKIIIKQSRTENGDTRRDAVISNNQSMGFWGMINSEFDSKHIICEFKNYATNVNGDQLNQLRMYLLKPTIGRFGLLFLRNKPTKRLLQARKRIYEESKILILIIDDELVEKMINYRVYTEYPEEILEELKNDFELSY